MESFFLLLSERSDDGDAGRAHWKPRLEMQPLSPPHSNGMSRFKKANASSSCSLHLSLSVAWSDGAGQ